MRSARAVSQTAREVARMNDADYAKARRNMVDSQILPNRVTAPY